MVVMPIVLLTNRKDYELFLSDVVFAFDGLEKFGFAEGGGQRTDDGERTKRHKIHKVKRQKTGDRSQKSEENWIAAYNSERSGSQIKTFWDKGAGKVEFRRKPGENS